jgi:hypothetical protein
MNCPHCDAPVSSWRWLKCFDARRFRCVECGGKSRVPERQLRWYGALMGVYAGGLIWIASVELREADISKAWRFAFVCVSMAVGSLAGSAAMKRRCRLVARD